MQANNVFAQDLKNLAHLCSQLLLYDRVVIPTYDFGILPALLSWLGIDLLTQMLEADTLAFVRRFGLLGYVGNGSGLSGIIVQPGDRTFEWWQEAIFGDSSLALELQFRHRSPDMRKSQLSQLTDLVLSKSTDLRLDRDFFQKHVVDETYLDVINSPLLSQYVLSSSQEQPDMPVDLRWLPQLKANQVRVLRADGMIRDPIDVVLRVSEINMELVMAHLENGADLHTSNGADHVLKQKLLRAGINPPTLDGFVCLLDLNNLPDIRPAIANREVGVTDLWRLRQSPNGRKFRAWLRQADAHEAREFERLYVEALGKPGIANSWKVRAVRFLITTAAGMLPGIGGLVGGLLASITDSFL